MSTDPNTARKKKVSGKSKTYAERANDRTAVTVWLSAEASERLDIMVERRNSSKRGVIEDLLMGVLRVNSKGPQRAAEEEAKHHEPADPIQTTPPVPEGDVRRALAERVRAAGSRRDAVVVRTGESAREGRVRR